MAGSKHSGICLSPSLGVLSFVIVLFPGEFSLVEVRWPKAALGVPQTNSATIIEIQVSLDQPGGLCGHLTCSLWPEGLEGTIVRTRVACPLLKLGGV